MIKPDARFAPTEDEWEAWTQHPVTRFVAAAYKLAADKQRDEWARQFDARIIPADISMTRLELKTREDAYRAFLESNLSDYLAIVDTSGAASRPAPPSRQQRRSSP